MMVAVMTVIPCLKSDIVYVGKKLQLNSLCFVCVCVRVFASMHVRNFLTGQWHLEKGDRNENNFNETPLDFSHE